MAIAVEVLYPGATTDQYDATLTAMGIVAGAQHPGALFHWATQTDAGVRVTDVWESKEEFDRFAADQVAPAAHEGGLPEPEMRFIDVHNYMAGR
jgi:hypothetical protein